MKKRFIGVLFLSMGLLAPSLINAQTLEYYLFQKAESKKAQADSQIANFFAAESYEKAIKHYNEAVEDYNDGDDLDDIRKDLNKAIKYFDQAMTSNERARTLFANAIDARNDAISANAPMSHEDEWDKAEHELKDAIEELDEGDSEDAREDARKSVELYREAELLAIETNYLAKARKLCEKADDKDADDYAPVTYDMAKNYIEQAEAELKKDRYDNDKVRELAKAAEYEARHAIFLNETIKDLKDQNVSYEALMRIMEEHFMDIANASGTDVEFDNGFEEPVSNIISDIRMGNNNGEDLEAEVYNLTVYTNNLRDLLDYKNDQIALLNERANTKNKKDLNALLLRIDASEADMKTLEALIARQEMLDAKYRKVRKMFPSDQGVVLRDGDKVIIRLAGFNFDVGQAEIKPENKAILANIEKALDVFKDEKIIIQGHTDAQGTSSLNMDLSQKRAQNVQNYVQTNITADDSRVKAVGYGESKPVANNEHAYGRAQNRRIDIVIQPDA